MAYLRKEYMILRVLSIVIMLFFISCRDEKRILVFTKTSGYRHASIKDGVIALQGIGKKKGYIVDTTSNSNLFCEDSLSKYSAIVFLSTTGELFDVYQKNAFQRYIQAGGGFVGIHAASDAEYKWPWYNKLVGAYFSSHPEIQEAKLHVVDNNHSSTKHLRDVWMRNDEWYNFKSIYKETKKLLTIDESSYKGGENGPDHPMSWYHEYDGGRAWYTALGHTRESFEEQDFLNHIAGGIEYAIGKNKRDYSKAITPYKPEKNRFTLERLVKGQLFEPTEMTILPNLDVLIAQRRGEVMRYNNVTKKISQIGKLEVYHTARVKDVNAEEGLMGIQKHPKFEKNGFVFMFYAVKDSAVNRLSRFYVDKDSLHVKSEKVVLDVASDRDICCHTGGSIAFSGDGNYLYLSTGDNATPFDEPNQKYVNKGFAPQDDRPGHEQYDARRSSANTNDLRGKILRIAINDDGSYTIPEGNLFPKDQKGTRPEIYVMGNRNPYRISVDPKNGNLYWGEVGPDAAEDKEGRGPQGYDEVNQAKKAGNFGWPLFVGNNQAYNRYDYATGKSGDKFDASKPINDSRNNNGLKELPPAQSAMIYYPYDKSETFPELASGGRNAMAGPVYYCDQFPKKTSLPAYYNGKLFIYDWIRQWIKVVHVDNDNQIEPFLEDYNFANIIDMEVAHTGEIYILEYGKGWFSKNSDSGLSKVVYNSGNRAPKIIEMKIDNASGLVPLSVTAVVNASDPENDRLKYEWKIGPDVIKTDQPTLKHTINDIVHMPLICTVIDEKGNKTTSDAYIINTGNAIPKIEVSISGNQSMYFPKDNRAYKVKISDDTDLIEQNILVEQIMSIYNDEYIGHVSGSESSVAEKLMSSSDCLSCHKKDTVSIGPSYVAIAERYKDKNYAQNYLAEKIRIGGSGNWGEGAMAAHPGISEAESMQITEWILSLSKRKTVKKKSLPLTGKIATNVDKSTPWNKVLYIKAQYTDLPTNKAKPLGAAEVLTLKPNVLTADNLTADYGFKRRDQNKLLPNGNGYVELKQYDLFEVSKVVLHIKGDISESKKYNFTLKEKKTQKTISSATAIKPGTLSLVIEKSPSEINDYILYCDGHGGEGEAIITKIEFLKMEK
jgi:glucose/arabinose dehydrogenase/cytochrome c551/c552